MAIRVSRRKSTKGGDARVSGFVCPKCKHWNVLGAYWAAHQHVELEGPCGNDKCDAHFIINGTCIELMPAETAGQ